MDLKAIIPVVPDFPRAGVGFLDITAVLHHPPAYDWCVAQLAGFAQARGASSVVAVESRGFLFGAPVAQRLGLPLVVARKPGKLPGAVHGITYETEYSVDELQVQHHAPLGQRPWVVDDVLATGGTLLAVAALLERDFDVSPAGAGVVVSLEFLPGPARLGEAGLGWDAVVSYAGS
ncbi:MAG: adenine phosphoribosyltransferase [Rhodocyclaceae bacterium]|nr:adenine phosphoribosyltransferase [Rhodocyclaceae bacterium]